MYGGQCLFDQLILLLAVVRLIGLLVLSRSYLLSPCVYQLSEMDGQLRKLQSYCAAVCSATMNKLCVISHLLLFP